MDYREAIDYLLSFADFERSGRFADRPDLAPMLALLEELGKPQAVRLTVHVAGSKGKGSTAAMIESILRQDGLQTGLYTSPHLHSFTERARVNGRPITENEFAAWIEELVPAVSAVSGRLTGREFVTFDLLTALAFLAFRERQVGVQVVEVGLGGRLDSTNVFEKTEVCVITPLSLEHTAILGSSITDIAREKAAIIKPGSAVIMAPQAFWEAAKVIGARAVEQGAELIDVRKSYQWEQMEQRMDGQRLLLTRRNGRRLEVRLPLLGRHQAENAATALAAVEALPQPTSDEAIATGLANVSWPGRLEVLSREPPVIADGAHNGESARRLKEALQELFPGQDITYVVGTSLDKDIEAIARELAPGAFRVIATRSGHPRAMPPERIVEAFQGQGRQTETAEDVPAAIKSALALATAKTVICLVGSLFVAADARQAMGLDR
ncbi:MAG TPA: Mur ligase family protein [Dehalococcoidia bacterium]|nr:Mur ligase family protein [Dehalococcoidia bacterium]